MQSAGNFYTMHEKAFGTPPYLVFTFNPELKWDHVKNIYRIKYPTLKITARSLSFFIMYMKDTIRLAVSSARGSGVISLVKSVRWFLNPRNILRPLASCYYADVLLRGKFKPDIIIVMTIRIMGTVAAIAKKIKNIPVVTICHGEDIINPNLETMFNLKHSDGIITRTNAIKELLRSRYDMRHKRFALIPDAIAEEDYTIEKSKDELRVELQIPEKCFVITSIGNMVPRKNFDNVIKAVYKLKKSGNIDIKRPIHVYMIGDGEELVRIKNLANHLHMNDDVSFLGQLPHSLRNRYLKASDVFIMTPFDMPDSIEGFGIVYIEASYYEVPSIGSDSGGVPEAVLDGKTGYIVKQKSAMDLAKRIQLLYKNEDLRLELGKNGRERVLAELMAPSIFDKYTHFLRFFIKEHHNH